jgi:hypothetical protein
MDNKEKMPKFTGKKASLLEIWALPNSFAIIEEPTAKSDGKVVDFAKRFYISQRRNHAKRKK